jgi:hypothetical protein
MAINLNPINLSPIPIEDLKKYARSCFKDDHLAAINRLMNLASDPKFAETLTKDLVLFAKNPDKIQGLIKTLDAYRKSIRIDRPQLTASEKQALTDPTGHTMRLKILNQPLTSADYGTFRQGVTLISGGIQ